MNNQEHWFSPISLQKQENNEETQFLNSGDYDFSSDFRSYLNLNMRGFLDDVRDPYLKANSYNVSDPLSPC